MSKIAVFIVDDHFMVIEGIRSLLQEEKDIELMGHASGGLECLRFLKGKQPDVILMDINMPEQSGVELCRDVKNQYPGIFVIGLSTFNQYSYIDSMMQQGASGYLLKNASREELVDAIHTAMIGKLYLSDEAARTLKNAADTVKEIPMITRREKEILRMIAAGHTNPQIAEQLYISLSTVDSHRKNLMRKLNLKNTALLIRWAVENKLV
jgi:DNA-binding NarL/FixJ family response regulator